METSFEFGKMIICELNVEYKNASILMLNMYNWYRNSAALCRLFT